MKYKRMRYLLSLVSVMILMIAVMVPTTVLGDEHELENVANEIVLVDEGNIVEIPMEPLARAPIVLVPYVGSTISSQMSVSAFPAPYPVPHFWPDQDSYLRIRGDVVNLWSKSFDADWTEVLMMDDLDGDGLKDILVQEHKREVRTCTLIAKGGVDGIRLWEESFNETEVQVQPGSIGDLDGDGLADVFIQLTEHNWETEVVTSTLTTRKGSDGTLLWESYFSDPGALVQAYPMGDLDGDGIVDLLVQVTEHDWEEETPASTIIAMNGSDGAYLWEESFSGSNVGVQGWTLGDLDGDGLVDVLIQTMERDWETGTGTSSLIARKGSNGAHLWEQSLSGSAAWISVNGVEDLNGDNMADVFLQILERDPETGTGICTQLAKSGSDGMLLWEESFSGPSTWSQGYLVQDVDGDGLADVLVQIVEHDPETDTSTSTLLAQKGEDGSHLWEESFSGEFGTWVQVYPAEDMNGDGSADVLVQITEQSREFEVGTSRLIARSGSDGTPLWEELFGSSHAWARQAGDLDGDGLGDILVQVTQSDWRATHTSSVIAMTGNDGTFLWEESFSEGEMLTQVDPIGDFDGDGLTDCLITTSPYNVWFEWFEEHTPEHLSMMMIKKGTNGTNLCTVESNGYIQACWGDLDGDGATDLLLETPTEVHAMKFSTEPPESVWPYVFKDPRRGTELYVDVENGVLRFVTSDGYDSGIVKAHDMKVWRSGRIIISYSDSYMRLRCHLNPAKDSCRGWLWDKMSHKIERIHDRQG